MDGTKISWTDAAEIVLPGLASLVRQLEDYETAASRARQAAAAEAARAGEQTALLHKGQTEAVAERGRTSFAATFERLFKP